MKDSKIELHLDILSVFWIIASIVSAGFGFTFGTFGFGLGLFGGTLCWLVIIVYRWWTKIIDEEKPS